MEGCEAIVDPGGFQRACGHIARKLFATAIDDELLPGNPFDRLAGSAPVPKAWHVPFRSMRAAEIKKWGMVQWARHQGNTFPGSAAGTTRCNSLLPNVL